MRCYAAAVKSWPAVAQPNAVHERDSLRASQSASSRASEAALDALNARVSAADISAAGAPFSSELTAAVEQFESGTGWSAQDAGDWLEIAAESSENDVSEDCAAERAWERRVPSTSGAVPAQRRRPGGEDAAAAAPPDNAAADALMLDSLSAQRATHLPDAWPSAAPRSHAPGAPPPARPAPRPAPLLPALDVLDPVPAHRAPGAAASSPHLAAALAAPNFRPRHAALVAQLAAWGYFRAGGRELPAKNAFAAFGRANPDLLYALPPRELSIFAKKFVALPPREVKRKVRNGAARLVRLYVDFELEPLSHSGAASFQDVTRLLLFVAEASFSHVERLAPGIVAAAADVVPAVIMAAAQPPVPGRRRQHSDDWHALREGQRTAAARKRNFRESGRLARAGTRRDERCASSHHSSATRGQLRHCHEHHVGCR